MPKPPAPPEEIAPLMRFIAEKVTNVKSPMIVTGLAAEFKRKSGSLMVLRGLRARIETHRQRIHEMDEFDMGTKVKMMFALSAPINKGFLNELKNQAKVEVDEKGRITKYQSKDGSLKLEGRRGMSNIMKSFYSDRWQKICQKANDNESEEEGDEDANGQKDYEKKRVSLVKFLIERTKNAISPWSLEQLAADYKREFKSFDSQRCIRHQIFEFRLRIHDMNQLDMPTKVRLMFALSARIDADFLKKLQKDAFVELDQQMRIKKYTANDGSLELEGDHSRSAKTKARKAIVKKKAGLVNDSSESEEEDDEEEDSMETDGSDEESDEGSAGGSVKSNQPSTSLPKRRSQRIRKSTNSTPNINKKRATNTQKQLGMFRGKKRARIAYSSSEASEDEEESMALGNEPPMNSEMTNNVANSRDDFDYDPPANNHRDENLVHDVNDPNSERNVETPEVISEEKEEAGTSSSVKIETMSLLEFLTYLRPLIVQYAPTLIPRIDEKIKKLEAEDQQVPFHLIIESLESCIQILSTPDEMDSDENTTPLSDFFYHLGMAMCNITNSSMDDFHVKMRKLATTGDEKVSMEHIRYAMQKTLDKILH